MRYLNGFGVIKQASTVLAVMAIALIVGASFGSGSLKIKPHIQIQYPDITNLQYRPCLAEDPLPCAMEAAALVTAIANLEAARTVAEEAYQEWIDCVDANGGPTPNPNPTTPHTVGLTSVLEAVK
jgi:hypothetical protein